MPPKNKQPFKDIAWNGISLKVPSAWEIDSLDATHMLIGVDGSPKIEIKWTEAPKRFTLAKYLKKFISQSQRILHIKIHELPTPTSFSHPQKLFEFFFFAWESGSSKGNGTLIFCSRCKRLTMIRFFSDSQISINSLPTLILASFGDHSVSDKIQWQLFGLNFSTPHSFKLAEYSFKPGCYIISLTRKKEVLKIFSWGPASFLLSKVSLTKFATNRLPQLMGFAAVQEYVHGSCLEWSYTHGRFKNADLLPFMKNFSLFTVFRIYHDQQTNRILGVMIDSSQKYEHDLIKNSMINIKGSDQ